MSHIFDANLKHFLPEWKTYVSTEKIMERLSVFLAEIPGGDGPNNALLIKQTGNVAGKLKCRFLGDLHPVHNEFILPLVQCRRQSNRSEEALAKSGRGH